MRGKNRLIAFVAAVACLALVVGSWAYFSSVSTINNDLETNGYGSRTLEKFTPKVDLEPGDEVDKTVGVTNTGDYDLVVRIKMEELWWRDANANGAYDAGEQFIGFQSNQPAFGSVTRTGLGTTASPYVYMATQAGGVPGETDGLTAGDESVMYKNLDLTNWVDGGDGYWYYKKILPAGLSTGNLLNSIALAKNTDIGKYNVTYDYSTVDPKDATLVARQTAYDAALAVYQATPTAANKSALDTALAALDLAYAWTATAPTDPTTITFKRANSDLDTNALGYAKAGYQLSIITEVCQAAKDAVAAEWATNPVPAAVLTAWGW